MITWMQRHNKYLVITIWVATIAFIGAGSLQWGRVKLGSKASSVATVGDVDISKLKYQYTYNNLYSQYAQKFGAANFDQAKAKQLGLDKIAFTNLYNQALFLNMADEYGIIVSPKEIAQKIASYKVFSDANGQIDEKIYKNFLRARGLRAKDFEEIIGDDIKVNKLFKLLHIKPLQLEQEAMSATFNIADKIKYKILKNSDVDVAINDEELKNYWEKNRANYLTNKQYKVELLYTKAKDNNFTMAELENFYKENSFNYIDKDGKVLDFNNSVEQVKKDLTLKKLKKEAILERNRFKKGKLQASESVTLNENDKKLPFEVWKELSNAKQGDFLKPKAVDSEYVTVHLVQAIEPKEMSFEQAKNQVEKDYKTSKKLEELNKLADKELKDASNLTQSVKDYLTLNQFTTIDGLTPQDSMKVIKYIFGSDKKRDKVAVSNGILLYEVVEQKILDSNSSNPIIEKEMGAIKNKELDSNLFKELASKYKLEVYVKGLQ